MPHLAERRRRSALSACPEPWKDRRRRWRQALRSLSKVSNMIGSENDRVQIICIRTGMKEIDGGGNLRSTIADRRLAFETSGWPAGLTSLVQESRRDRRNLRPSSHTPLPTFARRTPDANCPCKRVAT